MATGTGAPATAGRTIRWARYYDPLVAMMTLGRGRALRARTAALARIAPGGEVLDVGCGTGDLTLAAAALAGRTGRVCGIDAAPEMITVAQGKAARVGAEVDFRVAVIEALPFPDATFDVALSSLMMHHLPHDLKRRGLAEVRRVLRPGGRILIVDARRPTSHLGGTALALLLHGGLRVGVQDLPPLLTEAGFVAVETGEVGRGALGFVRGAVPDPATPTDSEGGMSDHGPGEVIVPTGDAPGTPSHSYALLNRLLPVVLRSPLHHLLSRQLLLLTFTGHRTGRRFTIPVTYSERDGKILVFSDQRWWRNLRGGAPVTVRLRGRDTRGWADVIDDPDVVARAAHGFIASRGARAARMINVRTDQGRMPTEAEVAARTRGHVVVAIAPR